MGIIGNYFPYTNASIIQKCTTFSKNALHITIFTLRKNSLTLTLKLEHWTVLAEQCSAISKQNKAS